MTDAAPYLNESNPVYLGNHNFHFCSNILCHHPWLASKQTFSKYSFFIVDQELASQSGFAGMVAILFDRNLSIWIESVWVSLKQAVDFTVQSAALTSSTFHWSGIRAIQGLIGLICNMVVFKFPLQEELTWHSFL